MKKYLIVGKHPVLEALKNKFEKIIKLYILEQNLHIIKKFNLKETKIVKKNFFNKILKNQNFLHQGFAAEILSEKLDIKEVFNADNIVILDGINDPRNQGAIFRNCIAFGIKHVILEKKFYNQESVAMHLASSGASMILNIFEVTNVNNIIKDLKKNNFWIFGLDNNSEIEIHNFDFSKNKNALILGSEGYGIRKNIKNKCDEIIKIEISNKIDSLNVSNASAIALYELNKKKIARK